VTTGGFRFFAKGDFKIRKLSFVVPAELKSVEYTYDVAVL